MKQQQYDIVVIGGSAGSMEVLVGIMQSLPEQLHVPIVIVLHRMKNVESELNRLLTEDSAIKKVVEPDDKQPIENKVYLAPQNYHLLAEEDCTFSLDYSEQVNFSRPSIDVSFSSFAKLHGKKCVGILLSGANKDGAEGLKTINKFGGATIVQEPATAAYPAMPNAGLELVPGCQVMNKESIIQFLIAINKG